jgi:type VI secretion system secreted protein VgrG
MATTQDGRLLSIITPLGKDFLLINKLSATEEISKLFSYEVELLHEENEAGTEPTVVDVQALLGQSATITIEQKQTDRSADAKRTFSGMISRFSQGMRHTRFTSYTATIVPHAWIMTQNSQSRIFQHKTVPDILKKVFEEYKVNVGFELQGSFKARNYCVQYRESDFEFVSRLMEEEGIYYFFEHADGKHKMIIANTPQSHRDCPSKSDIPYFIEIPGEYYAPSIHGWNVNYQLLTGKVTLWDYNFQLPTMKLDGEQPSRYNIGGNQELEFYDFPGGYARKYDDIDRTGSERSDLTNVFPDKQKTAEIAMQAFDAKHKTASGVGDCSSMTAGHRFKLLNHPNRALNGQYIITSITHEAVQSPTYISGDEVDQAYTNSFTCLPHGAGAPPFRPLRTTPKPTVRGSQTATVVGPAGEEIFTDKFGRVKVQLHWDREMRFDPDSSCWMRVATSIAGKKWGTMFIPRIGQEVMVDFLEGDPDQPIIVGSVYNPETMPHYELPKYKTLSYFKSRTSPDDGKGFNELRFEDKQGKEQVFIHSQKRMDVRVRGSYYETCGGNRQEVIGVRTDNKPGGNLAITVGGNYDLHVKDSMYIGIDKKLNETVKGVVVEDYQSSLSTMVKTKAELNAMEIIMEAKTKISLKVGGNCIVIDPSGITIAGTMVKINSGGFGTETGNPSIDDPLDAEAADTGQPGYLDRPRSGSGRRTRNRRQLNSQHYVAPPRPGEDARITAMRNTLANSAQGRHALEVYERYGINPTFRPGEGSTFDSGTNTTNLDPSEDPTTSALTFVHEMQHGQEHHEGTSGDIQNQSRNDYVNEMLQEEVDGTVRSIEARNELAANGTDVSGAHFPLENQYQQAHDQAIADARAANPNISDEEAAQIGRAAGRQRVEDGFRNGEVVTSNTNQSYPDYYGNAWDGQHPTP